LTSRLTAEDFTPLLFAGFTYLECREVLEAASGYKISRLLITRGKGRTLRQWARSRGLTVLFADFDVREGPLLEGKGSWLNTGVRAPQGRGLTFVYLGPVRNDLVRAKTSDPHGEEPEVLAGVLRIPPCCVAFYCRYADEARAGMANDYAPIINRVTTGSGPFPWTLNYIAQYFGHSLIHHFPCSWRCEASRQRAEDALALIAGVSTAWAELVARMCTGTVIYEGTRGVHMIRGAVLSRGDTFLEDDVVSTVYNDTTGLIKRSADAPPAPKDLLASPTTPQAFWVEFA
jgi:hypothetical protein